MGCPARTYCTCILLYYIREWYNYTVALALYISRDGTGCLMFLYIGIVTQSQNSRMYVLYVGHLHSLTHFSVEVHICCVGRFKQEIQSSNNYIQQIHSNSWGGGHSTQDPLSSAYSNSCCIAVLNFLLEINEAPQNGQKQSYSWSNLYRMYPYA